MALVLLYLVVLVLVAVVLFVAASLLFGRGEQLPAIAAGDHGDSVLPAYGVTGADVDAVKFTQVLRGYKTSEVDWVLDRLGRELEALRGELAAIHTSSNVGAETETDGPDGPDVPDVENAASVAGESDVGDPQDVK